MEKREIKHTEDKWVEIELYENKYNTWSVTVETHDYGNDSETRFLNRFEDYNEALTFYNKRFKEINEEEN